MLVLCLIFLPYNHQDFKGMCLLSVFLFFFLEVDYYGDDDDDWICIQFKCNKQTQSKQDKVHKYTVIIWKEAQEITF